ncbi:sodium:proton antiporter [Fructobacillus sp. M1-13]|uniref:Sodium:proton antiporter n=2 Tax=Fructobacillus papyriferae TaxID=2713171 RepID=A0ABS5QQT0_9LACO|nr:Na+/H+ antiporter NhaC family protein [Fructobacillus papyriferae]MBS9335475.1 sodium:proton antiporter [Fructobacillus papyriferae]MCD2159245.1 sodium:proton antiporter [Fructobacillus papyriferae]
MKTMNRSFATILLLGVVAILAGGIIGLGLAPIAPLLAAIAWVVLLMRLSGVSFKESQGALIKGIEAGIAPLFLFLLIGAMIALWLGTGVIPTMIWTGFRLINPQWFLPTALLTSALVGTMIGSAFTTLSTVGVALMGIGITLGFNPALVAGIIISGAIFGDKTSPLSDSTNLAAAVSETDLFAHLKNLMWTTIPAMLVTLVLAFAFGFTGGHAMDVSVKTAAVTSLVTPTLWSLVPILLILLTAIKKVPAIPALLINVVVCSAYYLLSGHSLHEWSNLVVNGYHTSSHNQTLIALLNRGGMVAMMDTVMLIMLALGLGGLLSNLGILKTVMNPLVSKLKSQRSLVFSTLLTGIATNFLVGEQYLSTMLPGQLFKEDYKRFGLSPLALSRAMEDSGAIANYLVPWGVAGAFASQTLHVSVLAFVPFTFLALLSPIFSMLSALTGIGLRQANGQVSKK